MLTFILILEFNISFEKLTDSKLLLIRRSLSSLAYEEIDPSHISLAIFGLIFAKNWLCVFKLFSMVGWVFLVN